MTKRSQLDEIKMLRRALADLYIVHTGRGNRKRLAALLHLHCGTGDVYDLAKVEAGALLAVERVLTETHKRGY